MTLKQIAKLLPLLALMSCGDDNIPAAGSGAKPINANSNAQVIAQGKVKAVTESSTTDMQAVANRLEIPKLKGGENNLFVVHTIKQLGVNYCMEYQCEQKASRWTAYQWYKGFSTNEGTFNRKYWDSSEWHGDPFQEDPLIPNEARTHLEDHTNNQHDRGHILASADRLNSKDANEQTFYLSNIHPQLAGFNQTGIWANLELRLRNVYDKDGFRDTLYVVKGGTIDNGHFTWVKGKGQELLVPKYFYMALLCKDKKNGYKAIAFWMDHVENTDKNYADYAISIDRLEELTGIDFFCNLPDDIEKEVEKNLQLKDWKLY